MTRTRFVSTLGALLAVFAGGGYVVNQFPGGPNGQITLPSPTAGTTLSGGGAVPAAGTSEGVATAPSSGTAATMSEAPAGGTAETQMKKEFDTAAADAAAETEAVASGSTAAESSATRSAGSQTATVTASLDAVQLSATGASVIAGQAPTGTAVTLLANDAELASTVSDESGAWTMILEEPVAPGTYKLKLKAVGPRGGEAVFRDVGETTVKAPDAVASAESTSTGETAAVPTTGEATTQSTIASTLPANSDTGAAAEIDVIVPEPNTFDVASVPPDLAGPVAAEAEPAQAEIAVPATQSSTPAVETEALSIQKMTPAETVTPAGETTDPAATTPEAAPAPASTDGSADTGAAESAVTPDPTASAAGSSSDAAGQTGTAQAATSDPALADQASEAAESLSDMFTDWLTATGDQAAEAAKTFSLTGATYKPVAKDKGVVTLSGRGPAKAEVRLFVDTVAVGVTKVAESGRWLADADHWVEPGAHSARAEIVGTDGTVIAGHDMAFTSVGLPEAVASAEATTLSPESDGAAAAPPVLLAIADVAYENMGPKKGRITVAGRAEPKARVNVFADGTGIGAAEAAENGDWTLASDTWIDVGAHAIRAERVSAGDEAVESTLTEFVRPPAEVEVAAAGTPTADAASQTEPAAEAAAVQPVTRKKLLKKNRRSKLARIAHRKRMAAIAEARESRLAKARKIRLAKARGPKLKTVTVQRGNAAVRIKVPVGKRKRRVLGYLHLGGTGWYRVRRGDTLWRIANRCYGNGRNYSLILASNQRAIRNPDLIYTRQRLYVP